MNIDCMDSVEHVCMTQRITPLSIERLKLVSYRIRVYFVSRDNIKLKETY